MKPSIFKVSWFLSDVCCELWQTLRMLGARSVPRIKDDCTKRINVDSLRTKQLDPNDSLGLNVNGVVKKYVVCPKKHGASRCGGSLYS